MGQALDDLATLASGLADRDEAIGSLIENLDTVAGTLNARDAQIRTMLDNLVVISQTFSDNTEVLDQASSSSAASPPTSAPARGQPRRDRPHHLEPRPRGQTVESKLPVLDHALDGLDVGAAHIFNAGRHGEWLNQDILCFATGPPTGNQACGLPFFLVNHLLDGAGLATQQAAIGDAAASNEAGADALEALVLRGQPQEEDAP